MPDRTFWIKQSPTEPAFPDLIWSRPENKRQAGKLLIIGGNLHGFSAAATAFNEASQAGVGSGRIILPAALQKTVSKVFPAADYAPSNPSGSFARASLAEWLEQAAWSDGVLLAGDLGNNSETQVVAESFLSKFDGQITLAGDAIDFFINSSQPLLKRADTTLVVSLSQLQKLAAGDGFTTAITSQMELTHLVDALHDFTTKFAANVILTIQGQAIVTVNGQVSSTRLAGANPSPTQLAAHSAVWWLQNPAKPFEALTAALVPANLA